jgi:hypothetical protein
VFFCTEGTDDWQHDLYEHMQRRIRSLHDGLGLPYAYMEWRQGLRRGLACPALRRCVKQFEQG